MACRDLLPKRCSAAETRGKRLFTKNTAACEVARRCIRCDACPVPEGYGEGLVRKGVAPEQARKAR